MEYEALVDEVVKEVYHRVNFVTKKVLLLMGSLPVDETALLKEEFQVQSFSLELKQPLLSYYGILISHLTIENLSSLAMGCAYREEEKLILRSLLSSIPVYLLESGIEYRKYKETAHKNLYRLYRDYENKITQYGIIPITTVTELLSVKSKEKHNDTFTEINFTSKNLLLEADLLKLKSQGLITLHLKKNCIITPSAADFIRNHNIKVKEYSEAGTSLIG